MKTHFTALCWNLLRGLIACVGLWSNGVWAECTDFPSGKDYVTSNVFPVQDISNFVTNVAIPTGAVTNQVIRTVDVQYTFTNCQIPHYAGTNGVIMGVQFFNDESRLPGTSAGTAITDSNNLQTGLSIRSSMVSHAISCSGNATLGYQGGKGTWITSNGGASCSVTLVNRHTLYRNAAAIQTTDFPGSTFSWLSLAYLDANGNFSRFSGWGGAPYIQDSTASVVQMGTHWDPTAGNSSADGGTGVWNSVDTHWFDPSSAVNGVWQDGAVAILGGTPGTVSLQDGYAASISGLTFNASGYNLVANGTGSLRLGANSSFTVGSQSTDLAIVEAPMTGTGALTKAGAGLLKLTGTNTYTGSTTVAAGVLQIGQGLNQGSLTNTASVAISSGASLAFNRNDLYTFDRAISGAGSVIHDGLGATELTAVNSYTGLTNVNAGRLVFKNTSATGKRTATTGVVLTAGATLEIYVGAGLEDYGSTSNITYSGTGNIEKTGAGLAYISGNGSEVKLSAGSLIKVSAGTLSNFWGSYADNYSSLEIAPGAVFWLIGDTNLKIDALKGGGNFRRNGGSSSQAGLTLGVANTNGLFSGVVFDDLHPLTMTKMGTGTQTFTGLLSFANGITINQGALEMGDGSTSTPGALTYQTINGPLTKPGGGSFDNRGMPVAISAGASLIFNRGDNGLTDNVSISGGGTVRSKGQGKVTLTANHTFTGPTLVDNGTLQIGSGSSSGSIESTSLVTVAQAATLAFNRSDTFTFSKKITGQGGFTKLGSGTTSLTGNSDYTGTTEINAGTLTLGATTANTLGELTAVTVATGATLNINGKTQTFKAPLNSNGTLNLGVSGNLTLAAPTGALVNHSLGAISGSGTITLSAGATLTLGVGLNNANIKFVLDGGTLNLGALTHALGTMTVNAPSTLDFSSAGNATLTVSALTLNNAATLTASNWSLDNDHFYATSVTGTPSRNTLNQPPLNQITMATYPATQTLWTGGSNEILVFTSTLNPSIDLGSYGKLIHPKVIASGVNAGVYYFWDLNGNNTAGAGDSQSHNALDALFTQNASGVVTATGKGTTNTVRFATLNGVQLALMSWAEFSPVASAGAPTGWAGGNYWLSGDDSNPSWHQFGITGSGSVNAADDVTGMWVALKAMSGFEATFWDTTGGNGVVDGGSGTWNAALNHWTGSDGASNTTWVGGSATAVFQGTAGTVSIADGYAASIGGLNFNTTGYTLAAPGSGSLALAKNSVISTPSGGSAIISAPLTGGFGLTLSGGSTILAAANTYTGATNISSGTLQIGNSGTAGDIANTSGVAIAAANATLMFNRSNDLSFAPVVSGLGLLHKAGSGKLTLTGNNTYTGGTLLSAGSLSLGSGSALGPSGTIRFEGATLQFTASNTTDYSARFSTLSNQQFKLDTNGQNVTLATGLSSSAGTLTKLGAGSLTLSGASTYDGNTSVNAGTLLINGSIDSNGAVTVDAGATLGGTGTAPGTITVNGSLSPGTTGEGTFNTGSVTFNSGATLTMDLNAPGTTGGAVNDLLVVTGDLTLDGALAINTLANFSTTGKYTLITYTGTRSGSFSSDNLAAQGYLGVIDYDDTNKQVNLVSLPRVRIAQTTTGGVGTFQFSLSGLASKQLSLTTVTPGVTVTSSHLNGGINTALEVVQTSPSGWSSTPTSVSCIDANGANNGNGSNNIGTLAGSKVVVLASAMKAGSDITCAFANTRNNLSGVVFNDGGAPSAGVNSGTPNDGLPNGGESGQAGVVVSLTNCASTVFGSTVTDNAGAYALNLAAAQSGQTVCVAITLPSKHVATGASAATTALPSGSATTVAGTAYTYTRSSHQVSFTASSSGAVVLNFGMVPESQLIVANDLTAAPGGIATHSHRFTAGTSGTLILTTQNGVSVPAALTGWSEAIYQDANCSGSYVSNAANWSPPNNTMSVTQGQSVCFVVREFVPANAQNGNSYSMQVKAQLNFSNASPSLSASYTVTDITTVSGNVVTLKKQVRNITTGGANAVWQTENAAQSGDVLEYQITFTNTSSAAVTDLAIQDGSPAWTTWTQASSGTVPANMTCTMNTPANPAPQAARACSPAVTGSGTGNLTWKFSGPLQPQASGSVLFRVTVN